MKKTRSLKKSIIFSIQLLGFRRNRKKPGVIFSNYYFFNYQLFQNPGGGCQGHFFNHISAAMGQNGAESGVHLPLFFSVAINYNYFQILGLGDQEPTFFFVPTTINYGHAAVNERNRQESLFFFRTNSIIGGPSQSKKKEL